MKRCLTCPNPTRTPLARYCDTCRHERQRAYQQKYSFRRKQLLRIEDGLNRVEPYGLIRRKALRRLKRSNVRWRKSNPDLADLLAREKASRPHIIQNP